ncbi:hypothetical protein AAG906_020823 [Vitis piasezkii]|uniref:zinc finger protein ZAT9-like n=1 Tax=Vitis riparia TaxID=96939 RepID=UPI00155B068D|nr:zinc finger protein ZAT9-like [Vitis riparia]
MAFSVSNFKHFCRICKKGFGCGRALGGHMRAHGIGDESGNIEEEDPASDWEDKLGGHVLPSTKKMYALRTNPNRLKSCCRVCENCGKEFLSWKSFLEHGKCNSDDAESLVSSPGSDGEDGSGRKGYGWSKRKRSLRAKVGNFISNCPSSEEEDLAHCLVMLSNGTVDPILMAEPEESCASASKEEERRNPMGFAAPMSCRLPLEKAKGVVGKGMFECKACKKVFNSHQALGGHRASHKKVKGCFAARLDHMDESLADEDVITHDEFSVPSKSTSTFQFEHASNAALSFPSKRKSKVHECSICHRVFSSGQALGGHKRCHWITSTAPDTSSLSKFHHFHDHLEQIQQRPKLPKTTPLDLNLPAPVDDIAGIRRDPRNPLSFEVSTDIYLRTFPNNHNHQNDAGGNNNDNDVNNIDDSNGLIHSNVEDEADSKVKLAKLSDLKDINMSGGSSPWLQVGIGSATNVGADS